MASASLNWITCNEGKAWCPLQTVNLQSVSTFGVYIIWNADVCVYVGQGDVAARLEAHRQDKQILAYGTAQKPLQTTWASTLANQRDGIERFLADTFKPVVGERHPNAEPIRVNLPRL